ncbi:uncharacterized protein [Arachis hypogaea]|uniref:uncharacterized protein n=1 Tax=Arachis hypogaea TaxID=3818 RepID=UPI003B21905A
MSRNRNKFESELERTLRRHLQQARAYKAGENLKEAFEKEAEELTMDPNTNVENPNGNEQPRKMLGSYTTPLLISMGTEEPNLFISNFLQICDTVKTNRVNPDVYKLMLLPFAMRDRAKQQRDGESLYEAWERFKSMIRKCPPDMSSDWIRLQIFYDGLLKMAKMSLKNSVGGSLHMKKTPKEADELIEMVSNNQYLYTSERNLMKKGVMELDTLEAILAQNKAMSQQISMITQHLSGMQVSTVNTQDAYYDMSSGFNQRETYGYAQPTPKQVNYMEIPPEILWSKQIPERPPNTLPGDTALNPKEECKPIIVTGEPVAKEEAQVVEAIEKAKDTIVHTSPKASEPQPKSSYPQKFQKETKDGQFSQILEKTLKGDETVVLTEECSALIQSNLPKKMPDPGIFQISCTIGNINFDKALCDLGTGINLMPLSVMKKLRI